MSSQGHTQQQVTGLEGQLSKLKADHALLKQAAETYERDFLDRTETGRGSIKGVWARRGVSTLQDWVLALFFLVFAAFLVVCIVYTIKYSNRPLFTVATILFVGPIVAIFFGALLLRFG